MRLFLFLGFVLGAFVLSSCDKKNTDGDGSGDSSGSSGRYLYVASGLCIAGTGMTTFAAATSSNQVYRIDMGTGQRDMILADYWGAGATPGTDTPVGVTDWDSSRVAVLVASGSNSRMELVPKSPLSTRQNFILAQGNTAVIGTAPRHIYKNSDGSFFITRTSGVEKISASGGRLSSVTLPFVGTCAATSPVYSSMALSGNSRVLTTAAAAVAKVYSAPLTGTTTATSACSSSQASPASSTATAVVYDSVHSKVLVAYAGATTADKVNSIAAYDIDESSGVLSNEKIIYNSNVYPGTYDYLLHGISAMALDPVTSSLYVATVNTITANVTTGGSYVIEKFTYDGSKVDTDSTHALTRVSNNGLPFYNYGIDTKCISQMSVGVY